MLGDIIEPFKTQTFGIKTIQKWGTNLIDTVADIGNNLFGSLINADWDFASTVEDDRAMLQEVYTMIAQRSEMVDELELVTAGHERGSANMIEHIAKAAAANHENVTHRVVLPYKEGETNYARNAVYRRNRFLARYCDTALLFKASSEESRMSHHMERCFNEWKPATRNWEAKPVVVKTRNS